MVLTPDALLCTLQRYSLGKNIFVAFSGGCDSHVLLHLCAQIPTVSSSVTAVYIDHGLQECAADWGIHCQQVAEQLGVNFATVSLNLLPPQGESLEAIAREARYQAIARLLGPGDMVLTAHHQEDQYETILLKMFRGAGLLGLSGISEYSALGDGQLIRPLLGVTKQAIEAYAKSNQLNHIQDPSNACIDFDRNYLRQVITPLIKARWPA
ncbi:MAG: tRNA lysidine(34) synthetase TilS, partial [Methylococcales bacterium]